VTQGTEQRIRQVRQAGSGGIVFAAVRHVAVRYDVEIELMETVDLMTGLLLSADGVTRLVHGHIAGTGIRQATRVGQPTAPATLILEDGRRVDCFVLGTAIEPLGPGYLYWGVD
jgi:hypothetical protein